MSGINLCLELGNLCRDPVIRTVGETPVTNFTLAVTEKYVKRSGEKGESVLFLDCAWWGSGGPKLVEIGALYKGRSVLVEGQLKTEEWTDKQGQKRSKIACRVAKLQLVGPGRDKRTVPDGEPMPQEDELPQAVEDADSLPF